MDDLERVIVRILGKRINKRLLSERHSDEAVDFVEVTNHDSSIIHMFHEFQEELDMRHDKYERLAKLSRNITIESKRVIFLLHRINGYELQSFISEMQPLWYYCYSAFMFSHGDYS